MNITNVLTYLEDAHARCPEKTAYVGESSAYTFDEVYLFSRRAGSCLANKGIYAEPVAVLMEKSPEMITAFFGCVYGGCYYVPFDAEMPRFRIELMLETLGARVMIVDDTTEEFAKTLPFEGEILRWRDMIASEENTAALQTVRAAHIDTDPLYIVFTSGSTGVPKGVIACHRSVIDYIENLSDVLGFSHDTVFGNQSPLYFDACLKELYPTLKFGATTYLIPKALFSFPVKLVEYLNEHRINTVCWVVSALTFISAVGTFKTVKPEFLRTVAFGSEVFPIKQFNRWREALPNAVFTNLYGPTEATGMCCYYRVDRDFDEGDVIPIGRPFANTQILLLNEENRRCGVGEPGEICVRGTSLTLGYYRNPEKTAAAYVQNPLNDRYNELIYRTGDIARYNENGELVYISRKDFQIKHMGHRIELGEIEVNVHRLPSIALCCAVYDRARAKIVLYYTGDATLSDVTSALKERLPRYMLPNRTEKLDVMPLTANGKIDRAALTKRAEENN